MDAPKYQTVIEVARALGLPVAWLKAEAKAGRIPSIRAGRRLLLDAEAVEAALLARAESGGDGDA